MTRETNTTTTQNDQPLNNGSQPDTRQPDTRQPDARQSDTSQPDTSQPDTSQPDARQPDARQSDNRQPDARQPNDTQPPPPPRLRPLTYTAEITPLQLEPRQRRGHHQPHQGLVTWMIR
jgi:hypothetical protein